MRQIKIIGTFIILGITAVILMKDSYNIVGRDNGIWIYEKDNKRCITFSPPPSDSKQTCIYIHNPGVLAFNYQKLMLASLYLNPNPKRILVMGLGGGTIVTAIQNLLPDSKIDVVEINPKMLDIAKAYFNFSLTENTEVFVQDGYDFIKNFNKKKYDLILFDIFDENYIPEKFLTEDFMESLKKIMSNSGVVAINTFISTKYSEVEKKIFCNVFGVFYILEMTNRIMIGGKNLPNLDVINKNAQALKDSFEKIGIKKSLILNKFAIITKN